MTKPSKLAQRPVNDLLFDTANPRLPLGVLAGATEPADAQAAVLAYFVREGNLDELARSYADNGYFQTEPLIVTLKGAPAGKSVVLEGNRRLAALRIALVGSHEDHQRLDITVTAELRKQLATVPVLEVDEPSDAAAMIGFRHIGGLKFWDSEAKARWIRAHVDTAATRKDADPFNHVARMVGMPKTQIRYYYLASSLVNVAREEKYDAQKLSRGDRFGVFLRAVESPGVRAFVSNQDVSTYAAAKLAIAASKKSPSKLISVLNDVATPNDAGKYVVGDSRNIPKYGEILANTDALRALRSDGFDAAVAVLHPIALAEQVRRSIQQLRRLHEKLTHEETLPDEVIASVRELQRVAKSLRVK